LQGVIKVGAVNVDEHKSLGGQYGVKGFPTVKIFGGDKNKPEDYNGPRTAQGLVDAGFDALRSKVSAQMAGKKSGGSGSDGKKVGHFGESVTRSSSPCSEEPTSGPCPWSAESVPHTLTQSP
jgi:protein disulfide-isomerase A6